MLQPFVSEALIRWSNYIDQRSSDKYYCWRLWCLYVIHKTLKKRPDLREYWNIFRIIQSFFSKEISLQMLRYNVYPYIEQCKNNNDLATRIILKCLGVICEPKDIQREITEIGTLCEKIFEPADLLEIGRSMLNEITREVIEIGRQPRFIHIS